MSPVPNRSQLSSPERSSFSIRKIDINTNTFFNSSSGPNEQPASVEKLRYLEHLLKETHSFKVPLKTPASVSNNNQVGSAHIKRDGAQAKEVHRFIRKKRAEEKKQLLMEKAKEEATKRKVNMV